MAMDRGSIARVAAAQHGVVTAKQLEQAGVGARRRTRLVASGEFVRLHQGAFATTMVELTWAARCVAALAATAGWLCRRSSGRVHDLDRCQRAEEVAVLASPSAHHALDRVELHRSVAIPPHHVTVRAGWRVTTVERTLVDLGAVFRDEALAECIQDAHIRRLTTVDRVEAVFFELARRGRPGIATVRRVLEELGGDPVLESVLEERCRMLLRSTGLPEPEWQPALPWAPQERGRVDALFADALLILEVDGRAFHSRADAFERDRRRDQDALAAGFRTIRVTARQLRDDRSRVVAVLRTVLAPDAPRV